MPLCALMLEEPKLNPCKAFALPSNMIGEAQSANPRIARCTCTSVPDGNSSLHMHQCDWWEFLKW